MDKTLTIPLTIIDIKNIKWYLKNKYTVKLSNVIINMWYNVSNVNINVWYIILL